MPAYAAQMVASTEHAMSAWQQGGEIDAAAITNRLALDIVARSFFSLHDASLATEIAAHVQTMVHMVNHLVMPWGKLLFSLPLPASLRYRKAGRCLNQIVSEMIERAHTQPSDDLLGILLNFTHPETSQSLTCLEIRDEIVTTFIAGHETVVNGLVWALYLLARHPEQQHLLRQEIASLLHGQRPTAADYPRRAAVKRLRRSLAPLPA